MKKPITIRIDDHVLDIFKKKYPKLLARFIEKAVIKALNDDSFLIKILFEE